MAALIDGVCPTLSPWSSQLPSLATELPLIDKTFVQAALLTRCGGSSKPGEQEHFSIDPLLECKVRADDQLAQDGLPQTCLGDLPFYLQVARMLESTPVYCLHVIQRGVAQLVVPQEGHHLLGIGRYVSSVRDPFSFLRGLIVIPSSMNPRRLPDTSPPLLDIHIQPGDPLVHFVEHSKKYRVIAVGSADGTKQKYKYWQGAPWMQGCHYREDHMNLDQIVCPLLGTGLRCILLGQLQSFIITTARCGRLDYGCSIQSGTPVGIEIQSIHEWSRSYLARSQGCSQFIKQEEKRIYFQYQQSASLNLQIIE